MSSSRGKDGRSDKDRNPGPQINWTHVVKHTFMLKGKACKTKKTCNSVHFLNKGNNITSDRNVEDLTDLPVTVRCYETDI